MIELTQLHGTSFTLNCDLIETVENIPETKILLTNGKYYLVQEEREEVTKRVIQFKRRIYGPEAVPDLPEETGPDGVQAV